MQMHQKMVSYGSLIVRDEKCASVLLTR